MNTFLVTFLFELDGVQYLLFHTRVPHPHVQPKGHQPAHTEDYRSASWRACSCFVALL